MCFLSRSFTASSTQLSVFGLRASATQGAYCDNTIGSLRRSIPLGLKSVSKENIANYVCRCMYYMFAYLDGSAVGQELGGEDQILQISELHVTQEGWHQ